MDNEPLTKTSNMVNKVRNTWRKNKVQTRKIKNLTITLISEPKSLLSKITKG